MIIGNGLLANEFDEYTKNNHVIIFASGVSNSNENRSSEFDREFKLIRSEVAHCKKKIFVYFSSTKILEKNDKHNLYRKHKLKAEMFIKENFDSYLIIRLPQVIGNGGNTNTLANSIFKKIKNNELINVWANAERHLIDIVDVGKIVKYLIENKQYINSGVNVFTYPVKVDYIVQVFEEITNKKAKIKIQNKGERVIGDSLLNDVYKKLNLTFDEEYVRKIINKYYFC